MKKNNLYAACFMAVVALTACNDEMHEIVQSGDNLIVEASMGIESRTSLKDDFSGTVIWSPNDQIYLFGGKSNATMTLKSGANTTRATFSGTVDGKTSELKTAIYPIPDIKNDKYTFELPATRKYSENSAAPMIGSLSGTHVSFKNLTALVRIPVWSNDKERVLTLTMDGIAGTLAVDIENHTADIVNGTNTVTITIPAGEACYVDIPVPAKEYNGYTVTLDNKEIAKKTDKVELSAQSFCTILTEPKYKEDNSGNVIYSIELPSHLMWVANQNDSFEGKELKLVNDLDFKNIIYTSIGDKGNGSTPFKGTFNGDNHTIYNLYQSGWEFGYECGTYGSLGLFSEIEDATVKNLTIEGMESLIEGGDISFIAGSATGTCVFENITIKNSTIATYNNGCGGIIGWSGAGPDEIIITAGGSEAVLFAFMSCLDPGDEIIVPEPAYANYMSFAISAGAVIRTVTTTIDEGFCLPKVEKFEELISGRTKAILICNPNNPTGYLYTQKEMNQIRDLVKKYNLFLFSDEVYREFIYTGSPYISAMHLEGIERNVVLIDSVSKRYSECGIRIGALITKNEEVRRTVMKFCQARLSPPLIGQIVAEASIEGTEQYSRDMYEEYVERRKCLIDGLNRIPGCYTPIPMGAFYTVAQLPVDDADKFCEWCLKEFDYEGETIMMAPASGFYSDPSLGKNQVRLAYILKKEDLQRALLVLQKALEAYPGRTI